MNYTFPVAIFIQVCRPIYLGKERNPLGKSHNGVVNTNKE